MIDLTGLPIASATPRLVEFGGLLTPALGGPVQRIDRMGSRWAWRFESAPMNIEPEGREWAARIVRAKREGARLKVSQPDFLAGDPGNPVVLTATASGRVVPLVGLAPGYVVREGSWLSVTHAGRSYLDQVADDAVAGLDFKAVVTIQNLLRSPLSFEDPVELVEPRIEGWIEDPVEWPLASNRTTMFAFTIAEAA
jgi:hypothetical protein